MTAPMAADGVLAAPVAAHVTLRRARPLRAEQAVGVPPGHSRFLIEAELTALIRGEPGTPAEVRSNADVIKAYLGETEEEELPPEVAADLDAVRSET